MESQRLISSLHKIHGIRTRVPKKFRTNRKKKTAEELEENDGKKQQLGAGVPTEITISASKSSDSKDQIKTSNSNSGSGKHKRQTLREKTPQIKTKTKTKKVRPPRVSVITAAKAGVDMNMFSIDDDAIGESLEGLDELATTEDFESSGKYNPESTNVDSKPESLFPQIQTKQQKSNMNLMGIEEHQQQKEQRQQDRQQQQQDQQQDQKEDSKAVEPLEPLKEITTQKSSKIGRQVSKQKSIIGRQHSNASSQDSKIPRQQSSFAWLGSLSNISRQNSWFSRQESQAESEEPDEETPEEKAARVAALRYYPIAFNIDQ